MERNRESRRAGHGAAGASRRPRGGPLVNDISDEDEKMDDSPEQRAWERSKKDRIRTFQSVSRFKRRQQDIQLQGRSSICEDADESREETENPGWGEDDDEPPPRPSVPKRLAKIRGGGKEDEMIMDIPAVPRKARSTLSSSSRFSVMKHSPSTDDPPLQQSSLMLDGISSPNPLGKSARKPKPSGMKSQPLKASKVLEPTTISDQEVEVAEALFVLARSAPSNAVMSQDKLDCKSEAKIETCLSASSSPPNLAPTTVSPLMHSFPAVIDGHSRNASLSMVEAPKRKRPRVIMKQEEGKIPAPCEGSSSARSNAAPTSPMPEVVQVPLPESQERSDTHTEILNVNNVPNDYRPFHEVEKVGSKEENRVSGQGEPVKSETQVLGELKSEEIVSSTKPGDFPAENDTALSMQPDIRSSDIPDDNVRVSPSTSEQMVHAGTEPSTNTMQLLIMDHSTVAGGGDAEAPHVEEEESCQRGASGEEMDNASRASVRPTDLNLEEKQEAEKLMHDPVSIAQAYKVPKVEETQMDSESIKTAAKTPEFLGVDKMSSGLLPSSIPDAAGALASWMSSLPAMGYYSSGAPKWPSDGPLLGSNLDEKSTHTSKQLPASAIVPRVAKSKHCATHVYLAHFINREQCYSRHSMWSAAVCRGAPYSLDIPPMSFLENGKLDCAFTDLARKGIAPQSTMSGMTFGSSSLCNSSATSTTSHPAIERIALESGSGTVAGGAVNMAAHAQYLQAMMQQNGCTFPFTFNMPNGQASQFFNGPPFYPAHLMPPLSHIQSQSQQASTVLPAQKQQQGLKSTSANVSQRPSQAQSSPAATQQRPLAPRSPSTSHHLQQSHIGSSAQNVGGHLEKEIAENLSSAESRVSVLQRSMCGQGLSNLPNLNASPSSLVISSTITTAPLQPQDISLATIGGKFANKSQHNGSLNPSLQHHESILQSNSAIAGLQIDARDPLADCLPSMGLLGMSRGSVGPGSHGLLSVVPQMTTQSHGLTLKASESSRGHAQQQQAFSSHSQQFQRSMARSSVPAESNKGQNSVEERKPAVKQGVHYSEGTLSAMHGSLTSGGQPNAQMGNSAGQTLNSSVSATVPRSSRPASSAGSGQVASTQNHNSKQATACGKTVAGDTFPSNAVPSVHMIHGLVPGFADRALPVNLGKPSGNAYAFPGPIAPTNQGSKQVQGVTAGKATQRLSFGQPQQVPASVMTKAQGQSPSRGSSFQHGVSGVGAQMLPNIPSSGTLSMSVTNPSSVPKGGVVVPTSKSPSNGKGSMSSVKSAQGSSSATKRLLAVSGPLMTSVMASGQSLPYKAPAQQKSQTQVQPSFAQPQQMANVSIQQRIGLKNSVGSHQQLHPLQQGSNQYKPCIPVQSSYKSDILGQQLPSQTSSHQYLSTPQSYVQAQHRISYDQSHRAILSLMEVAATTNLPPNSPNFSLGSGIADSISSISSKVADQLQGTSPTKASPSLGNTPVENMVSAGPSSSAPFDGQQIV